MTGRIQSGMNEVLLSYRKADGLGNQRMHTFDGALQSLARCRQQAKRLP